MSRKTEKQEHKPDRRPLQTARDTEKKVLLSFANIVFLLTRVVNNPASFSKA